MLKSIIKPLTNFFPDVFLPPRGAAVTLVRSAMSLAEWRQLTREEERQLWSHKVSCLDMQGQALEAASFFSRMARQEDFALLALEMQGRERGRQSTDLPLFGCTA